MVDLHGILEPGLLQKAEGNCKVLVSSQLLYKCIFILFMQWLGECVTTLYLY